MRVSINAAWLITNDIYYQYRSNDDSIAQLNQLFIAENILGRL